MKHLIFSTTVAAAVGIATVCSASAQTTTTAQPPNSPPVSLPNADDQGAKPAPKLDGAQQTPERNDRAAGDARDRQIGPPEKVDRFGGDNDPQMKKDVR